MNGFILSASLLSVLLSFLFRTSEMNRLNLKGNTMVKKENYVGAAVLFHTLKTKYNSEDELVTINLAHALFLSGEYARAQVWYEKLLPSKDKNVRSMAWNQLGLISYYSGDDKDAYHCLRRAIIENYKNKKAVYNYELLKKMEDQPDLKFQQDSKFQPSIDGQNKKEHRKKNKEVPSEQGKKRENEGGEREKDDKGNKTDEDGRSLEKQKHEKQRMLADSKQNLGMNKAPKDSKEGDLEKKKLVSKKMEQLDFSPEKALQILDAMQSQEIRYLQQVKHKSENPKTNTPDY